MRQMIEALAAAGPAPARALDFERRIGLLVLRLGLGERGLEFLEGERQLIVGDALGSAAKMRAADLLDDRIQPRVAGRKRVALDNDGSMGGALGQDQCPQGIDIVGQRVARMRHGLCRLRSRCLAEKEPERCRFWRSAQHRPCG